MVFFQSRITDQGFGERDWSSLDGSRPKLSLGQARTGDDQMETRTDLGRNRDEEGREEKRATFNILGRGRVKMVVARSPDSEKLPTIVIK